MPIELRGITKQRRGLSADAQARHQVRVDRIARQLRARRGDRPLVLRKRAVSHQVPKPDDKRYTDEPIDVGDLVEILSIDTEARTCTAESGVTFDQLVRATLAHGLIPVVVPELRTITVGGAVTGCSLESMSFRHGGFHDGCLEYEVLTASGEVLRCAPDDNPLLFQMIHGSFGTLGILTRLTFRLVPAGPFVRVDYETHTTLARYQDAIWRRFVAQDIDFMDGFLHAPTRSVLCLGRFVDEAPYTNRYDWLKVYYRSTTVRSHDYLATIDYLFRYDNGVTNVHPGSWLGRLLFGKFLHSAELLRLANTFHRLLPRHNPSVTVDLFIPFSRMEEFMAWYRRAIDHFPLWCVPYRRVRDYEWLSPAFFDGINDSLFIDLALYGAAQPRGRNYYREIEEALVRVNGVKTLISYNYYSPEEFWSIFNRPKYAAVKAMVDPGNAFRDLYDKTCLAPRGL